MGAVERTAPHPPLPVDFCLFSLFVFCHQVMHHPDLGHGGLLLAPQWQAQFVGNLRGLLSAGR